VREEKEEGLKYYREAKSDQRNECRKGEQERQIEIKADEASVNRGKSGYSDARHQRVILQRLERSSPWTSQEDQFLMHIRRVLLVSYCSSKASPLEHAVLIKTPCGDSGKLSAAPYARSIN
jgi:hypothetical protein